MHMAGAAADSGLFRRLTKRQATQFPGPGSRAGVVVRAILSSLASSTELAACALRGMSGDCHVSFQFEENIEFSDESKVPNAPYAAAFLQLSVVKYWRGVELSAGDSYGCFQ